MAATVVVIAVFEDLTVAILTGEILSLLLYAFKGSNKFKFVELKSIADGEWDQELFPETLTDGEAMALDVTGTVYFTSIYSFDELLPDPSSASSAAVTLQISGREAHCLTLFEWLEKYAHAMQASGYILFLSGVENQMMKALDMARSLIEELVQSYTKSINWRLIHPMKSWGLRLDQEVEMSIAVTLPMIGIVGFFQLQADQRNK